MLSAQVLKFSSVSLWVWVISILVHHAVVTKYKHVIRRRILWEALHSALAPRLFKARHGGQGLGENQVPHNMRRRPRRSESPPLRRARAPPPRTLEEATQKVTRKIVKDRSLRGGTVDVDQVYERQQENAQIYYQAFEAELRRNFQASHGRPPNARERARIEEMAEQEAGQELVEDDHDRRVRRRGRGAQMNLSRVTEPEDEAPDPHDYEEREDLEQEPLPPPTTMGAQVDRHRRWGFKR